GLQIALVVSGAVCALAMWRLRARRPLRAALTVGMIGGFLGFTLVTPQIIEHFLLVYGALLIVFLVTMPDGMAGFLRDLPGVRRLQPHTHGAHSPNPDGSNGVITMPSQRPSLRLDDVKMSFGGVWAVDGVSMAVEPGQVHGLIGPNGSGKSTLVNVVTGVYTPTGGAVRLGDRVLNDLRPHNIAAAGVTRTFQNIQLFKDLTVPPHVIMGF